MRKSLIILCALLLTAVGASAQGYVTQVTNTSATWIGATGQYSTNVVERYSGTAYGAGKILYQAIGGLSAGTYSVSFYAAANMAWIGATYGDNIAQVFANETVKDIKVAANDSGDRSNENLYTLECTVGVDGVLEYGLQNIATGGNWYVCQGVSITLTEESTPTVEEGELHTCVADIGHWTTTGNNGTFVLNDWSTEDDASGMKTPFCQNWVYEWNDAAGTTLTTATINHSPFSGLPTGYYEVSLDIRILNELGTSIGSGTTFSANDASEDIDAGVEGHEDGYGNASEVYGTYHLLAQVAEAGMLNISIQLPTTPTYNWIAWKNLKVVYDGTSAPTLEAVTGNMNSDVAAAMQAAIATYNTSKSSTDYTAAMAAIMTAEESIAQYAEIAELVAALDAAGQTVWEASTSGLAYAEKTLATSDDISADMSAAQKAQTTPGSDMTYVVLYEGSWTAAQGNGPNAYSTGTETYCDPNYTVQATTGKVLYKTIEGLQAGTYTVSFYAASNHCNGIEGASGTGLTQVYANDVTENLTVGTASSITLGDDYLYTLTNVVVDDDGKLEFGIENTASPCGNWYVCQAISLTFGALADDADYEEGDEIEMLNFKGTVASGNLFVNGGFNNGVEGWTAGNKYADALSESNVTIHQSGGYNDGPYVTIAAEGASSEKTPNQAIAVEPGKSYLFVGYTNYSGNDNDLPASRYSALFIMDSETAERSHLEGETSYSDGLVELQFVNNGEWVKTEGVFTVPAEDEEGTFSHVGMRMNWSTASYDGLQLYEVEGAFTFPEDADYAIGDEVTISDVTYTVVSDNLVENGSFNERTTGWTYGNGHAEALYPYNVLYSTDGGYNDGPYITSKGGGSSADTTPSKEVDVKTGKTYLFVGYTNGTAPDNNNKQYNGLFTMSSETAESGNATIQMKWGDPGDNLNGWTKTEDVFTATTNYVGLRFAWCPGASFDGMQLYEIEKATEIEWTLGADYGTLILPFDYTLPEELTAYTGTINGDEMKLTAVEGDAITAYTPYIIGGETAAQTTYTFSGVPGTEEGTTFADASGLVGVLENTYAPANSYVLQLQDEEVGPAFYLVEDAETILVAAYHCYLTTTSNAKSITFTFGDDVATAIEAVEATEEETAGSDAIYDLSGRRVAKAQKGVYIVNGKKMVIK